jgi:hypothetical protein
MGVFDTDLVKKEIELTDIDRFDLLLDYAFDYFCDLILISQVFRPSNVIEIEQFFTTRFRQLFNAIANSCPLPWFPDHLAPYLITYLKDIKYKDDKEDITIIIKYSETGSEDFGIHTKKYTYDKDWLNVC